MKSSNHILIFFMFIFCTSYGQGLSEENYLLISFEKKQNKQHRQVDTFFWIIPLDSIDGLTPFSPIYFKGYSKSKLDRCINNKIIYIFNAIRGDDYNFSEKYKNMIEEILKSIEENKVKFLTLRKKWKNGLKETIDVFATPITGIVCNCPIVEDNADLINYYGQIYLPIENFTINKNLWTDLNINFIELEKKIPLTNFDNTAY